MESRKFDRKHIDRLNDPDRVKIQDPDLIWDRLALTDPQVLIDIGAGTGFFALPFSDKMAGGTVYACDISDDMLSWMAGNFPERYRGIVVPTKTEETRVPLPDGNADLVYMANLHHELEEPPAMMLEAYRLLKPNGVLMIIDWSERAPFGPPQEIRVPETAIRDHIKNAGFADVQAHDDLPYSHFLVAKKPAGS